MTRAPHSRARFGIRWRLLATTSVVVAASVATTIVVAALVGPPSFQRLMDAAVQPGFGGGDHPYLRAFERATALSVGTALAVSAAAALALSWFLSRRAHRSATALAAAAAHVADGHYDVEVPPTGLGSEFDDVAAAFTTMARRLGEADRARRQMVTDLAHEIRTPVAVLDAYFEALEDGVQALDATTIRLLREQTTRLARFCADVGALATAEQRTPSAAPLDLADILCDTVAAFEPRYRAHGIPLTCDVGERPLDVLGDGERLGQVFANLLDNALRHSRAGDPVVVAASVAGDAVVVRVSDHGDGIPAEHLDRVFERFHRVDAARDREHGGAGIGLAIARAYVESHRGTIGAHSPGRGLGATFVVTLPRSSRCRSVSPVTYGRGGRALPWAR